MANGSTVTFLRIGLSINRRAALKLLTLDVQAQPGYFQRFVNEARSVNQISHPGVVQVYDFGIDAGQSFNSGYAQYYPGAGLRSVGVGTSALWRITDKLTFVAFGSYNYLADVAASSPLVQGPAGSRNQFVVGSALSWRFEW